MLQPSFDEVYNPLHLPGKTPLERQKVFRTYQFFFLVVLTSFGPKWRVTKCSEPIIFCSFDFEMYFAPRRPALFSTSEMVRAWCVLHMLTRTCAWRQNDVHFFLNILTSLLFGYLEPQKTLEKTWCFATSPPCDAPASSLF